uniref:winged helix-turn-helix domain-containing protein n=1 Tax=Streptomyces tabacisoli TaxID=3156398 RepID=UPI003EBD89E9
MRDPRPRRPRAPPARSQPAALSTRAGEAVSRETLMAEVWDENWFGSTKTLDVTMASLRHRLTTAVAGTARPAQIPEITTLRGHGYRLDR